MDGWVIAFGGMSLTALGMLALGLWLGYRWGTADADIGQAMARQPRAPLDDSLVVRVKHVAPSTAELFRQLEADRPLGELVQPSPRHAAGSQPRALRPAGYEERATDAIARWTAEADAYIAGLSR